VQALTNCAASVNNRWRIMRWAAVTPGEDLFLAIRDHALPSLSAMESCWEDLSDVFLGASGSHQFAHYLRGAVSIVAMKRLLQFWEGTQAVVVAADQQVFQLGLCGPDWLSMSRARIVRSLADGACFTADSVGRDKGRKLEVPWLSCGDLTAE
jgi:hypothetical protein